MPSNSRPEAVVMHSCGFAVNHSGSSKGRQGVPSKSCRTASMRPRSEKVCAIG